MQRAIIVKESKVDNGGTKKQIQNSGRHVNADNNKAKQSERMGHRRKHSTVQLLILLFSGFTTKCLGKLQIRWLRGEDKWIHSFASLGFQMKGRYNLHIQKIEYINIFWQEEKHLTIFKATVLCLVCIKFYWKQKREHESYRQEKRQTEKFFTEKKGGKFKFGQFWRRDKLLHYYSYLKEHRK